MNYEIETLISDTILLYVFYHYMMKFIYRCNKVFEVVSNQVENIVDEHDINYFKNIYLKEKVEYLLMVVEEERRELYKYIYDQEEYDFLLLE